MKALISCVAQIAGCQGLSAEAEKDDDDDDGGVVVVVGLGEVGQVRSEWTCEWHRRVMWPVSSGVDGLRAALLSVSADTGRW